MDVMSKIQKISDAAKKVKAAQTDLDKVVFSFTNELVLVPMCNKDFWTLLHHLKEIILTFRDSLERSNWPEGASDEFCRSAITCQTSEEDKTKAIIRCVKFANAYRQKVREAHKRFSDLHDQEKHKFFMGDDTFSDMCDSFPLHGQEVFEEAMRGNLPEDPELGENYMRMSLENAAKKWLVETAKGNC